MTRSPDHPIPSPDFSGPIVVGVISDTHGLLRPEAVEALHGSDAIIHAGDIGDPSILPELERIAPVTAVRGNIDTSAWGRKLPETNVLEIAGVSLYVLHNVQELDIDPAAAQFTAVIFGHSHKPLIEWRKGVLFFNPGSAGPRRFTLPISIGRLTVTDGKLKPELIQLK
jgi:putative phosphoesterase